MNGKTFLQVAAALIEQEGKFLITRRKRGTHLEGLWEFPGGKRKANESLEACVEREISEELGIQISQPIPFMTVQHEYPDKAVELHFFSCATVQGEPRALDCDDFCWIKPEEFSRYQFPDADTHVIARLIHHKKGTNA